MGFREIAHQYSKSRSPLHKNQTAIALSTSKITIAPSKIKQRSPLNPKITIASSPKPNSDRLSDI
ncbi:MAG: hypothetical protein ACK5RE_14750 [Pseudanabaena sp.]